MPQGFNKLGFDNIIQKSKAVVNIQSMQGVVVKSYPTQSHNAKFYLHEVFVINKKETGSPNTAASHKGRITTSDPVSDNRVTQTGPIVNTQSIQGRAGYSANIYGHLDTTRKQSMADNLSRLWD